MPKYVIEREMPGAGKLSEEELIKAAKGSNAAVEELGNDIQWVESYVTDDKFYCVYIAKNEELIREHGKKSGFPVDRISKITGMTDPVKGDK